MNAETAAALIGKELSSAQNLHGGDLSVVQRLHFVDGTTVVLKIAATAATEARMLSAIAASGASSPGVLAVSGDMLLMQDLGRDQGPSVAWADLGRQLRRLHATRGAAYGWDCDHAFGPVPVQNAPVESWPDFWARRRLLPFLPHLPRDVARRIEALAARLHNLLPVRPLPALLHGDLWTGNIMARDGHVTGLIDPACYHGHAEVDLAMLCLFGTPDGSFWDAYRPDPGLADRRPIYQLFPALVHLRLFGPGYLGLVERCVAPFA